MNLQLDDINKTIEAAIAPVFLLTGVGTHLVVLTNRLARIIDRSRKLEEKLPPEMIPHEIELDELHERSRLINRAIVLSSFCAFLVCVIIAALFLGDALDVNLSKLVAAMFVLAVLSLTGSIFFFLREILVATGTLERHRLRRQKMIEQIRPSE